MGCTPPGGTLASALVNVQMTLTILTLSDCLLMYPTFSEHIIVSNNSGCYKWHW